MKRIDYDLSSNLTVALADERFGDYGHPDSNWTQLKVAGFDPKHAPMYAQMLVGMVALTGQWWLDTRKPKKADVAAHLVNLAWNGLSGLEPKPRLITGPDRVR